MKTNVVSVSFFDISSVHMVWLTFEVMLIFQLLAPEANFAALEVVVKTHGTFPAAFWELELDRFLGRL